MTSPSRPRSAEGRRDADSRVRRPPRGARPRAQGGDGELAHGAPGRDRALGSSSRRRPSSRSPRRRRASCCRSRFGSPSDTGARRARGSSTESSTRWLGEWDGCERRAGNRRAHRSPGSQFPFPVPADSRLVKILVVNWQDRENPQAGGAEIHLHEIFGRLAARGHEVTLLCGGWPDCPPRATLDGIDVIRIGTRLTWPALARGAYRRLFRDRPHDVLVEDINKMPLFTPRWGARRVVALVPHLFGGTAFQELAAPLAAVVWLSERPLAPGSIAASRFTPSARARRTISSRRGIRRDLIRVIYPGIDTRHYTPASGRCDRPDAAVLLPRSPQTVQGHRPGDPRIRRGGDSRRDARDRGRG